MRVVQMVESCGRMAECRSQSSYRSTTALCDHPTHDRGLGRVANCPASREEGEFDPRHNQQGPGGGAGEVDAGGHAVPVPRLVEEVGTLQRWDATVVNLWPPSRFARRHRISLPKRITSPVPLSLSLSRYDFTKYLLLEFSAVSFFVQAPMYHLYAL